MPLVKSNVLGLIQPGDPLTTLEIVCRQLIPATYSTDEHPVTPGSIIWTPPVTSSNSLEVNVFVESAGYYYYERADIIEDRAKELKAAFSELFPGYTFAVWPTLVHAGWAADYADPDFRGDLSMPAAVERARQAMEAARRPTALRH